MRRRPYDPFRSKSGAPRTRERRPHDPPNGAPRTRSKFENPLRHRPKLGIRPFVIRFIIQSPYQKSIRTAFGGPPASRLGEVGPRLKTDRTKRPRSPGMYGVGGRNETRAALCRP